MNENWKTSSIFWKRFALEIVDELKFEHAIVVWLKMLITLIKVIAKCKWTLPSENDYVWNSKILFGRNFVILSISQTVKSWFSHRFNELTKTPAIIFKPQKYFQNHQINRTPFRQEIIKCSVLKMTRLFRFRTGEVWNLVINCEISQHDVSKSQKWVEPA